MTLVWSSISVVPLIRPELNRKRRYDASADRQCRPIVSNDNRVSEDSGLEITRCGVKNSARATRRARGGVAGASHHPV
jgi:hypothetical protein